MLIKRTIDKPSEKLDLLVTYLKKNAIYNDQINFKKNDGLISINWHYIEENKVCEILQVSKVTIRNWDDMNNGFLSFSYHNYLNTLERIKYGLDIKNYYLKDDDAYKKRYYSIFHLLQFLCFQKSKSNRIKSI